MSYQTYPLRFPPSLRAEINKLARQNKLSVNQFILLAAVDKLASQGIVYDLKTAQTSIAAEEQTSEVDKRPKRGYSKWKLTRKKKVMAK